MWRWCVTSCGLLLVNSLLCRGTVVTYVDEQGGLFGFNRPEVNAPVTALEALATPPRSSSTAPPQ